MGIAKDAYRLLLEEKKKGVLKGDSVLQLGRQCILFGPEELRACAKKQGVALTNVKPSLSFDSHYKKLGYIDDITLFKALGFKSVHSLDYSGFEGADLVCDLNRPVDPKYWGRFDVIYDGGTAEHVFHFPQLLRNIHLMLKENGVIIHVSPSHNHVDHGFYMFSPQVYSQYYHANQYEVLTSQVFEYSSDYKKPWTIYQYHPGVLDRLSYGGFGKKMLAIHLVARKTPQASCDQIPQQGSYVAAWGAKDPTPQKRNKVNPIKRLGISLNKKIKRRLPFSIKMYLEKKKLTKI